MKKLLTLSIFLSSYIFGYGQLSYDARLKSKFSEKELVEMQTKNAKNLEYLNFYVANAYQINQMPSGKSNAHEIKGTIKVKDINNINIYELNLNPLPKDYQYYKIEGSDKLLVILSEDQIKEKFNQLKK